MVAANLLVRCRHLYAAPGLLGMFPADDRHLSSMTVATRPPRSGGKAATATSGQVDPASLMQGSLMISAGKGSRQMEIQGKTNSHHLKCGSVATMPPLIMDALCGRASDVVW
jgi:hypothetical protein